MWMELRRREKPSHSTGLLEKALISLHLTAGYGSLKNTMWYITPVYLRGFTQTVPEHANMLTTVFILCIIFIYNLYSIGKPDPVQQWYNIQQNIQKLHFAPSLTNTECQSVNIRYNVYIGARVARQNSELTYMHMFSVWIMFAEW